MLRKKTNEIKDPFQLYYVHFLFGHEDSLGSKITHLIKLGVRR